jgi:hypothetical protein
MGEPFSTEAPAFASVSHPLAPTARWGSLTGPYPTNAAWMDFVLGSGVNPVNIFPYEVKALANGLEVCLPSKAAQATFVLSVFNHDRPGARLRIAIHAVDRDDTVDDGPIHLRADDAQRFVSTRIFLGQDRAGWDQNGEQEFPHDERELCLRGLSTVFSVA